MRETPNRHRKPRAIIDGYDEIEVASIDSFPASDPPGWIEATAHPCPEESPAPATKATSRKSAR
jgi:hypothetical protein